MAYVDNPFFDPLDPATLAALDVPRTEGHSVEFDLAADLGLRWRASPRDRLDLDLGGGWTAWRGDAETTRADADLALDYTRALGRRAEAGLGVQGATAAIAAFPDDDLYWGEAHARVGAALGDHWIDAQLGLGLRHLPDRRGVLDDGSPTTGQQDTLLRARLWSWLRIGESLRLMPAYALDLTRAADIGLDHDTHALSLAALDHRLGLDWRADLAGWLRRFEATPDASDAAGAARVDLGLLVGLRVGRALWPGVEVAGRYRYTRSASDDAFGDYGQHFAGFELRAWLDVPPPPPPPAPADATPRLGPDGWTFRHHAPDATRVAWVGDFNDWSLESHPMRGPDADGWWSLTLPLPPGRHGYMFAVDGALVTPVDAPATVDDGFGGRVGVLYVVSGRESSGSVPSGAGP